MRWILLTLLVANLALGGYIYWQSTLPDEQEAQGNSAQLNNLGLDEDTRERLRSLNRQPNPRPEPESEAKPEPQPAQCIRITGISGEDQVDVIESRLGALEVSVNVNKQREVIRTDYWVVLGPFDSDSVARKRLNELHAKDKESFLITRGKLAGAISLGLFSSRSNAVNLRNQLVSEQIDARIEQVDRTRETTVLTVGEDDARLISDPSLESILEQFDGVSYQRYSC